VNLLFPLLGISKVLFNAGGANLSSAGFFSVDFSTFSHGVRGVPMPFRGSSGSVFAASDVVFAVLVFLPTVKGVPEIEPEAL